MIETFTLHLKVKLSVEASGKHFYLRDKQRFADRTDILTITGFNKTEGPFVAQDNTPVYRYDIGFEECCDECRSGKFHHNFHEVGGRIRIFEMAEKEPLQLSPPGTPALDLILWMSDVIRLWYPDRKSKTWNNFGTIKRDLARISLGSYQYTINYDMQGLPSGLTISRLAGSREISDTYFLEQVVPSYLVTPLETWYKAVEPKILDLVKLEQEANAIIKKLKTDEEPYGAQTAKVN